MADINKTLKRAIDGPAPQHYSQQLGDFVVTSDVNPLPSANYVFNGTIWVPVSNENPFPTQLTGSNVEYVYEKLNVVVTAGSADYDIARVDVSNYSKIILLVFSPKRQKHDFSVLWYWWSNYYNSFASERNDKRINNYNTSTGQLEIESDAVRIGMHNHSDDDYTYNFYLMGVR